MGRTSAGGAEGLLGLIVSLFGRPGEPGRSLGFPTGIVRWTLAAERVTVCGVMSAKQQLRERIEALTEHEAKRTLRLLDNLSDPLTGLLDNAPIDDEPTTPEEEAAVQEGLDAASRGETISLDELRDQLR